VAWQASGPTLALFAKNEEYSAWFPGETAKREGKAVYRAPFVDRGAGHSQAAIGTIDRMGLTAGAFQLPSKATAENGGRWGVSVAWRR
jgi:hypothetical protein